MAYRQHDGDVILSVHIYASSFDAMVWGRRWKLFDIFLATYRSCPHISVLTAQPEIRLPSDKRRKYFIIFLRFFTLHKVASSYTITVPSLCLLNLVFCWLVICRPSGCTVVSGVVGVCNRSQMRTSKYTFLIFGVCVGLRHQATHMGRKTWKGLYSFTLFNRSWPWLEMRKRNIW